MKQKRLLVRLYILKPNGNEASSNGGGIEMKQKIMIVLLITLLCGLCAPCTAEMSDRNSDDFSYVYLEDGTICITAYHGSNAKISVPAYIDGLCVTQIGEMAFVEYEVPYITSVTLPDTVRIIGDQAFSGCTRLSKINMPAELTELGDLAFMDCGKLTKLTLPASLKTMGINPFTGCTSLQLHLAAGQTSFDIFKGALYTTDGVLIFAPGNHSSMDVKVGTVAIGAYAFAENSKLKKVNLPDTVTEIRANAFNGCSSLQSIPLPESLVSIGEHAFLGCQSLKSVSLPLSLTNLSGNPFTCCDHLAAFNVPEAHESLVSIDGVLCEKKTETLVSFPAAKGGHFTVPEGIRVIGREAFYNCRELRSLRLPDTVTALEEDALRGCISLTDLLLPDSVAYMGKWALADCGFSEIHLPSSLTEISDLCFDFCTHLTRIDIPQNITRIGDSAFQGCFQLAEVTIPESVTEIGQNAFNSCFALRSVTLPSQITSIQPYTFIYCSALKEIRIPDGVTEIGEWAFEEAYGLEKIHIPASVQAIGSRAFGIMNDSLTIVTPSGSFAEAYAAENGIRVEFQEEMGR